MENKTEKYFKYAISEILLVIIGILIAVSINDWNEDRKLRNEEQSLLKDLKQEVVLFVTRKEGLEEELLLKQEFEKIINLIDKGIKK